MPVLTKVLPGLIRAGALLAGLALPAFPASDADVGAASPRRALPHEVEIPARTGSLHGQTVLASGARDLVIIVPGGGPIDRDGNGPLIGLQTDSYRLLAEGLGAQGISSIRIDKRGFFSSADAEEGAVSIAHYAQDLRDWVDYAQPEADCIWLAGHSEGGIVALVAALAPPEGLCGVILMAVPGRPVGQLLLEQIGKSAVLRPLLPDLEAIVADIEAGRMRDPDTIPLMLRPFFLPKVQQHMMDLFRHDPALIARIWDGPALILQGDRDIQVPVEDSALLFAAMPQAQMHILSGATHMLKTDQPDLPLATYVDRDLPLHPDVIGLIAGFIRTHQP